MGLRRAWGAASLKRSVTKAQHGRWKKRVVFAGTYIAVPLAAVGGWKRTFLFLATAKRTFVRPQIFELKNESLCAVDSQDKLLGRPFPNSSCILGAHPRGASSHHKSDAI